MQLKKQQISIKMMQRDGAIFQYKRIKKCHDLITGTNLFHRDKTFSPGQNVLTGTLFVHRIKIFHSGTVQYGGRQATT